MILQGAALNRVTRGMYFSVLYSTTLNGKLRTHSLHLLFNQANFSIFLSFYSPLHCLQMLLLITLITYNSCTLQYKTFRQKHFAIIFNLLKIYKIMTKLLFVEKDFID